MSKKHIKIDKYDLNVSVNVRNGMKGDILFIHGLGCSKESFSNAFSNDLFSGFRLLAPDLPGFGESQLAGGKSLSMRSQANYLKELLNNFDIKNPIIVAHSMGGAIGLHLAGIIDSCKHFFCLEGNLLDSDCTVSKGVSLFGQDEFVNVEYLNNVDKYRYRYLPDGIEDNPVSFYKSSVSLVEDSKNRLLLNMYLSLRCPKTYIYGEKNRLSEAVSLLHDSDIAEIKGAGHFMMNKNPGLTYLEIERRIEK